MDHDFSRFVEWFAVFACAECLRARTIPEIDGGTMTRSRWSRISIRKWNRCGLLKDVPSKRAAQQKLALILEPIDDFSQGSKMRITFREFIEKSLVYVVCHG